MLKTNPIGWISIPAAEVPRAVKFYNHVFDLKLEINEDMRNRIGLHSEV